MDIVLQVLSTFGKIFVYFFTILCVHFGAGVARSMCGVMTEIYFFTFRVCIGVAVLAWVG